MPVKSSPNHTEELRTIKAEGAAGGWSGRLLMLVLNYIPLSHAVCLGALVFVPMPSWWVRVGTLLVALYLAPPLAVRFLFLLLPIREQKIAPGTPQFFAWWASFQFQVLFCRFPALEELLRMIPGVYSLWLRLWGSRIGRFTYWSAGTLITDRSFLFVGDDVVFGAGVRLNAHVITKSDTGKPELLLAPIRVGDRALVGGYSLLTAGTEIAMDEATRSFLISPPFSVWKDGKRVRNPSDKRE